MKRRKPNIMNAMFCTGNCGCCVVNLCIRNKYAVSVQNHRAGKESLTKKIVRYSKETPSKLGRQRRNVTSSTAPGARKGKDPRGPSTWWVISPPDLLLLWHFCGGTAQRNDLQYTRPRVNSERWYRNGALLETRFLCHQKTYSKKYRQLWPNYIHSWLIL